MHEGSSHLVVQVRRFKFGPTAHCADSLAEIACPSLPCWIARVPDGGVWNTGIRIQATIESCQAW
jgi:hypothetical protein